MPVRRSTWWWIMRIRLVPTKPTPATAIHLEPLRLRVLARPQRVLDFDIENRPLSYLGSDFTTAEVTAIAWAWCDRPEDVSVYLLGETPLHDILSRFCVAYNHADMVTGHYIIGHDLPMINGGLMECRLPLLGDKAVQDTKIGLPRTKGLSLSQESLAAMFRLEHAKQSMNQAQWRSANRLTPEGIAEVRRRVVGDVTQHIALRRELLALGYLRSPSVWRPGTAPVEYTP
jgi:hypothetical protein